MFSNDLPPKFHIRLQGIGLSPVGHVEFVEDKEAWRQTCLQEFRLFLASTISQMFHI
jgi:hypothetical protein